MRWLTACALLITLVTVVGAAVGTAQAAFPGTNGKIAFESNRDGNEEIYVMNADGTNQTNLTNNAARDYVPAWSPDGSKIAFGSTRDGNDEIYVMNADGSGQVNLTNDPAYDAVPTWSPDGSKIAFASNRDGNDEIYVMNADGSGQTRLTNDPTQDFLPAWSPDGSKIAFTSYRGGNEEIVVMNADGSGQVNLTNTAADDFYPDWSPDGSKITFFTYRDGNYEIYVMNADGSGQVNVTNHPATEGPPAWSPDGGKIVFNTGRDGNGEIYVMNADGTGQVNLTNNAAYDDDPDWQRLPLQGGDGGKIAFRSDRDGNDEVYVMNADGSGQTNLTNHAAFEGKPAWSPDGSKIAFTSTRDGNYEIYVMNADGSGQTRLTNHAAFEHEPAWSPDGSKIAFLSTRDGNGDIYVMNADGSGQTRLTNHAAFEHEPAWSPDGSKIAFASTRDGNDEVYVMNADGSGHTNLTDHPAEDRVPTWSPDGSKIAFSSTRDGNHEIYVMNADGANQTRLTNNSAQDWVPAWSPDGTKITFASYRDGNYEVYVMSADGSAPTNLTNNPAWDLEPDWQPLAAPPDTDGTDLYDPDVRLSDSFYPCPDQTDFNRAPYVDECLDVDNGYAPLQPLIVDTNQTQCNPAGTSVVHVQRTGPVGFAGTPSVLGPGWVDGTISWDLYATVVDQSGPAMPNVQPFPDDGIQMESIGFPTGSLTLQGTFTIDPNDPSIPNISGTLSNLSNDANWGVCRTFYEEVTGNDRFGPAPITGEFYVANGGALTYEVTAGPANLLGETGVAEAYFMNTFATCCDAEAPTGVNSASGHFRLQFGTWSPSEGTGGTAPTPTGTDVEVTDFAIADEDLGGVKLTFDSVTNEGAETSVVLLTSMPDQPSGFLVGDPPAVYQIETTAEGWSEIEVCLPYGSLPAGATPQIKHYVDGTWIDVPVSYDSGLPDQIVCGVVDSLSPFAVGYTHIYNVSGPFQPVDPQPTVNVMKAGRTVPVKFSLGGNFGLDVFAVGYPKSQQVACEGGDPLDAVETTSSTNSGLAYDAAFGTYQYNWKTQSAWKGKCRTLVLQFSDGQELKAEFKFN